MAGLEAVTRAIWAAPPRCGPSRVVCIDGPAGSGKSTLADRLSRALGSAPVVHTDDLYEGWRQDLGRPLAARVEAWLLVPWSAGLPGRHLAFDWVADRYREWVEVPPAPVLILEGCGSGSALIRRFASAVIWVEAPTPERMRRGLQRDGAAMEAQWRAWQAKEDAHFAEDATAAAAMVWVDGVTGAIAMGGRT